MGNTAAPPRVIQGVTLGEADFVLDEAQFSWENGCRIVLEECGCCDVQHACESVFKHCRVRIQRESHVQEILSPGHVRYDRGFDLDHRIWF